MSLRLIIMPAAAAALRCGARERSVPCLDPRVWP